jgi:hypothetical protein
MTPLPLVRLVASAPGGMANSRAYYPLMAEARQKLVDVIAEASGGGLALSRHGSVSQQRTRSA